MGIGSVTSTNSMSGMQMIKASSTDSKSKSIQNDITDVQQKLQKLDSKEELSASEKTIEREKLQKEKSSLDTELKQHQEELSKSYKREIMLAELQEDKEPAKEETSEDKIQEDASSDKADEKNPAAAGQQAGQQGTVIAKNSDGTVVLKEEMNQDEKRGVNTETKPADESKEEDSAEKETKTKEDDPVKDTGISRKKMHAIVSADSSLQQANRQGTVIARTRDGIAILKSEMNQDEMRGANTERKQADLEKMEKTEQQAIAFQSSILSEANDAMKAAETTGAGIQVNAENNAYINALKALQEDQTAPQNFHISFSN
ncbi:MAG: hypothetical protein K2H41_03035 [Acetatifactor sp.]|nr:hypothetical protein [Acetatifactor sp.]MDE7114462.1 hypothetical protein [Acetatifactor sp.]